ncbi:hypothetical protein [Treponema bryantii]|uniref:hypothetical protein n=1 Tax=Treponema bryantii TaxID=163 RepID=UPI0030C83957
MMIQGKSCTLTVAKDGEYYPLPYSEETVRQASKGYALPGVIGIRNREKLPASDEKIGNSNFSSNVSKSISLMIFYI